MNYPLSRRSAAMAALLAAAAAAGFGVAALYQACAIYDTSLLSPGDGGADAPATTSTVCGISPPPQPTADDPSPTPGQTYSFIAAMQSIDVGVGVGVDGGIADGGDKGPLPPHGWDLDSVCTCPGPSSCVQPEGGENCDDSEGRDNTGIRIFRLLDTTAPIAQQGNLAANQAMQAGLYGMLIEVTGYNGQANDQQVTVSIIASNGVVGADGGPNTLHHDGTDQWTLDPRYVEGMPPAGTDCSSGCTPATQDTTSSAYVADNILVASFEEVDLTFGGRANIGGAEMALQGLKLVGTLVPQSIRSGGESWKIEDGTLSGRWQTSDLLQNMATIPDSLSDAGAFLCGNDLPYQFLKNAICGYRDINNNLTSDNVPGIPCNSISMSLGFTAEPAKFGVVAAAPPVLKGCVPEGGGSFSDDCH